MHTCFLLHNFRRRRRPFSCDFFAQELHGLDVFFGFVDLVVVKPLEVKLAYSVIAVRMMPDDWLESAAVYAVGLPNDADKLVLWLVLRDDHVGRGMVLLVAHQNVRHQR